MNINWPPLLTQSLIFTMLAHSLTLVVGFTGLTSLTHAAFFGIGAYTSALLALNFVDLPFFFILIAAMVICGIFAYLVAIVSLKHVDEYYILITLGIQYCFFYVFNNFIFLTKGPIGITGIPDIKIMGYELSGFNGFFTLLTLLFALIVGLMVNNVSKSHFGRLLLAISEDEIFTQSLGVNVRKVKIKSFMLSSILAAVPGVLYAYHKKSVFPDEFEIEQSIFILSIVVIGGMRKLSSIMITSFTLVILPEILTEIKVLGTIEEAIFRRIFYGLIIVFAIIMRVNKKEMKVKSM